MDADRLSYQVIGAGIEVHRRIGPGLLESAYEECLARELTLRGIPFERQKYVPVVYKGIRIRSGLRIDFLVDGALVVELKAVEELAPVHHAQLLTYLRMTGCAVGLLLNFNAPMLRDGIRRLVLSP